MTVTCHELSGLIYRARKSFSNVELLLGQGRKNGHRNGPVSAQRSVYFWMSLTYPRAKKTIISADTKHTEFTKYNTVTPFIPTSYLL